MVRPFLQHVTLSELHAIMTGGFATIAGAVFWLHTSTLASRHLIC